MTKLNLQLLLKKYNLEKRLDISKMTLNDDGTFDYGGYVDLRNLSLKEIPIPFNKVNGNFYCDENNLTSLKNCPKEVDGSFRCYNNQLISLKNSPKIVHRNFICSYNNLTSLEGAPKIVKGYFSCFGNPTQFTYEEVKKVCRVDRYIFIL